MCWCCWGGDTIEVHISTTSHRLPKPIKSLRMFQISSFQADSFLTQIITTTFLNNSPPTHLVPTHLIFIAMYCEIGKIHNVLLSTQSPLVPKICGDFSPPATNQLHSRHQLGVLQYNSIQTQSTWRKCQILQLEDSVLQNCLPLEMQLQVTGCGPYF